MSKTLAWFLIGVLALNFGACSLLSYLGSGVSTTARRYPLITSTSSGSSGGLIRSGSIGGGSSRSGGGPSFGK